MGKGLRSIVDACLRRAQGGGNLFDGEDTVRIDVAGTRMEWAVCQSLLVDVVLRPLLGMTDTEWRCAPLMEFDRRGRSAVFATGNFSPVRGAYRANQDGDKYGEPTGFFQAIGGESRLYTEVAEMLLVSMLCWPYSASLRNIFWDEAKKRFLLVPSGAVGDRGSTPFPADTPYRLDMFSEILRPTDALSTDLVYLTPRDRAKLNRAFVDGRMEERVRELCSGRAALHIGLPEAVTKAVRAQLDIISRGLEKCRLPDARLFLGRDLLLAQTPTAELPRKKMVIVHRPNLDSLHDVRIFKGPYTPMGKDGGAGFVRVLVLPGMIDRMRAAFGLTAQDDSWWPLAPGESMPLFELQHLFPETRAIPELHQRGGNFYIEYPFIGRYPMPFPEALRWTDLVRTSDRAAKVQPVTVTRKKGLVWSLGDLASEDTTDIQWLDFAVMMCLAMACGIGDRTPHNVIVDNFDRLVLIDPDEVVSRAAREWDVEPDEETPLNFMVSHRLATWQAERIAGAIRGGETHIARIAARARAYPADEDRDGIFVQAVENGVMVHIDDEDAYKRGAYSPGDVMEKFVANLARAVLISRAMAAGEDMPAVLDMSQAEAVTRI